MPDTYPRSAAPILAVLVVTATALLLAEPAATAAAPPPRAQAVGRFLDGRLGSTPLEAALDLADARASSPGTPGARNPFDVTVGGQRSVPLSGALQAPGAGDAMHIGVANQVARARPDGWSFGAAGAVADSGGASIGARNNAFPADATLNLSPAALPSPGTLPLPGAGSLPALGAITASAGAVSALAQTPAGSHRPARTSYAIGRLQLTLSSPALGAALARLADAAKAPTVPGLPAAPRACSAKKQLLSPMSLDGGAVVVRPSTGTLTLDVAAVLRGLGADLNRLPANTDLDDFLGRYLAAPSGLSAGLQQVLHGVVDPPQAQSAACLAALTAMLPAQLRGQARALMAQLVGGQQQLESAVNQLAGQLAAAGGSNPLAPLADGLRQALDLGVNVQPHGPAGSFVSSLRPTPDQARPAVPGQTLVRALEIDLGRGGGASTSAAIALANAAAGPSAPNAPAAPVPPTHSVANGGPDTRLPTAVPAGAGAPSPPARLPRLLLLLAGATAVGAAASAALARSRLGRRQSP
jgi:hypothetical protein